VEQVAVLVVEVRLIQRQEQHLELAAQEIHHQPAQAKEIMAALQ